MLGIHRVILAYADGEVYLESSQQILGLEIHYKCNGSLAFDLPEGWLYDSNDNKIIAVSLNKSTIENGKPFIGYSKKLEIGEATFVFDDLTKQTIRHTAKVFAGQESERGYIHSPTDQVKSSFGKTKIADVGSTTIADYKITANKDDSKLKFKNKNKTNADTILESFANNFERMEQNKDELKKYIRTKKFFANRKVRSQGGY